MSGGRNECGGEEASGSSDLPESVEQGASGDVVDDSSGRPDAESPPPPPAPVVEVDKEGRKWTKQNKRVSSTFNVHNTLTHFPKDPNCDICNAAKAQRAPCGSGKGVKPDDTPLPQKFADAITADHAILNEENESRDGDHVALIIQDRATSWCEG